MKWSDISRTFRILYYDGPSAGQYSRTKFRIIHIGNLDVDIPTDKLAVVFHAWCCEVLMRKCKGISVSLLYKLAHAITVDSLEWQDDTAETSHSLDSKKRVEILVSQGVQPLGILVCLQNLEPSYEIMLGWQRHIALS
jgi:hypothetical protein